MPRSRKFLIFQVGPFMIRLGRSGAKQGKDVHADAVPVRTLIPKSGQRKARPGFLGRAQTEGWVFPSEKGAVHGPLIATRF